MQNLFLAFLVTLCVMFACKKAPAAKMNGLAGALQDSSIVRLWPNEMDTLLKTNLNIPIIDVRSELEFTAAHIYHAMNCDVNAPDFDKRIVKLGLQTPVIVYDEASYRSLQAAMKMRALGFKRTYELAGGIVSWGKDNRTLIASTADSAKVLK